MNFEKLLQKASDVSKLAEAVEKENTNKSFADKDEGFWQPTVDKAGNGYALIRFLPPPPQDGEDGLPWAKYFSHGFKGPSGLWYIENSLTTLGQQDPVSDYNSKLWATGLESNKKIARDQKRKLSYVSNILVVSDPKNSDNDGKVFKFRYGKKIFDKIEEAMNPAKFDPAAADEGKVGIDPFHFITGANFKLKIRNVENYRNYDKSEWETPTALFGGDAKKLKAVWESEYSLKEIVAPKNFKDYATLKQRLDRVLGFDTSGASSTATLVGSVGDALEQGVVERSDSSKALRKTAESVSLGDNDDPELFANLVADEDD
jgi:hypothetical protein